MIQPQIAPGNQEYTKALLATKEACRCDYATRADLVALTAPGRCSFVKRRRFTEHLCGQTDSCFTITMPLVDNSKL
ncbi:MAG: hypothetical protein WD625_07975 [Balneolales bacterium]